MDTIFAQASARGKAGVAVIRISGPLAWMAGKALCGTLPPVRTAGLRELRDDGDLLDTALVLCFEAGASFTGEDTVELQLHGATATIAAVLRFLSGIDGLRGASPGEFTRRAFENGRLDLAQVEGLADLIEAETDAQRRQALRVLSGAVGTAVDGWRADLTRVAALIAASIDFADEDLPASTIAEASTLIGRVLASLEHELAGAVMAERIRDGFEVAIVGRPNAGKSTLLNALAGREAAITSEVAGTTRDAIEVRMDLDGLAVTLIDTAGLREAEDAIEAIGVSRAVARAKSADLRVFLMDGGDVPLVDARQGDIFVHGKADLHARKGLSVSGLTGAGVAELTKAVAAELDGRARSAGVMTRERHMAAVDAASVALGAARHELACGKQMEIAAEYVGLAMRALESLIGRVDVEQLLDEVFSSFCIGK